MNSVVRSGWHVDAEGIRLPPGAGGVVDVHFDDRRVWSFSSPDSRKRREVPWPTSLRDYLDGTATVTLIDGRSRDVLFRDEIAFTASDRRVSVADRAGRLLTVDKWGFLQRPFETQDPSVAEHLLTTAQDVLRVLEDECGLPAWVAFGSLLGAVRAGRVIGHDNDVDLAYLSSYESPVDVARELFRVARALQRAGYTVVIKSASFVTVITRQSDGSQRDIDVYACFFLDDHLYETATVRAPLPREAVLPLGTVQLEGRTFPAPADPARLLAASYGPDWRIPNPAFSYSVPRSVNRQFFGWFGNFMRPRRPWDGYYRGAGLDEEISGPSPFARWVADRETQPATILDVGCGNGRDSRFFAARGHRVLGLDLSRSAVGLAKSLSEQETATATGTGAGDGGDHGDRLAYHRFDLNLMRDVLSRGAIVARTMPATVLYARLLVDAVSHEARENLARFAEMTLRRRMGGGGRMYLEFGATRGGERGGNPKPGGRADVDPDEVVAAMRRRGARLVARLEGRGLAPYRDQDPYICRLVLDWP